MRNATHGAKHPTLPGTLPTPLKHTAEVQQARQLRRRRELALAAEAQAASDADMQAWLSGKTALLDTRSAWFGTRFFHAVVACGSR